MKLWKNTSYYEETFNKYKKKLNNIKNRDEELKKIMKHIEWARKCEDKFKDYYITDFSLTSCCVKY